MTFFEAVGIGIGVGVVHASMLLITTFLSRRVASKGESETIRLMRERNDLDAKKVILLKEIAER